MNSGPYFSSAPSSRPMIQPNFSSSFCEEILFSCFEDSQEHIVSLQNENCLTSENYTVTHNSNSLDVKNHIGLSSLTNFFESQLTLRSINDVFKEIDKRTNKIKLLSEAIKSARLHNFHRKFSDVLSTILALETVDLALLKEGTNDIARMKAYQSSTGFKISGESEETLNKDRYEAQRTFVIPGMGKRLFEWHIKIGIDIRIHYYIDKENDLVYIGHCGKHLDI
ncbi:hypothetical protein ABE15_00925 [Bacillus cereus]|nr:hypothetical protein [Bacillus cereus]